MAEPASTGPRARALERVREIAGEVLRGQAVRVYLFGSSVSGRVRPSSDIDLAIEPTGPLPPALLADLHERLEESDVPYDVDVVDLSKAVSGGPNERGAGGCAVDRLSQRLAEARLALASFAPTVLYRARCCAISSRTEGTSSTGTSIMV